MVLTALVLPRKEKDRTANRQQVNLRMAPDTLKRVDAVVEANKLSGWTRTALIELAVEEWLDREEARALATE